MWTFVAVTGCAVGLVLVLRQFPRLPDFPTRFLVMMLWARYALQAFPETTVPPDYAGFSIVALVAIGSAGALALLLDRPLLRMWPMVPILAFVAFTIFTGLMNGTAMGLVNDLVKWIFFTGVALLTYRSIMLFGMDRTLRAILCAHAAPIILQYASVVLNNPRISELDGSISYIGGYYHEAMFSQVLFSFLCIVSLIEWRRGATAAILMLLAIIGLMLANYRTAIIATLPMVLVLLVPLISKLGGPRNGPGFTVLLALAVAVLAPLSLPAVPERYADVFSVFDQLGVLLKAPEEFTLDEQRLFNGRILIWSIYLDAYSQGSLIEQLIGFGPNAWEGRFRLYAHNTFVSALYEFGLVGLIALSSIFAFYVALAAAVPDRTKSVRLVAAQIGFVILNLATMPLWLIEGRINYAILLACSWAALAELRSARESQGSATAF